MPKSWSPKVRDRARLLWTKHYSREQIRDELLQVKVDVPIATIRNWTEGLPRTGGEPWDFTTASVQEVGLVRFMYMHAVDTGQAEPWPSKAQARWFARIRLLVPKEWPVSWCYDMARYAAAVPESEQGEIARALMLWSADPARLDPKTPLARQREEATVGGTAYATLGSEEVADAAAGAATL